MKRILILLIGLIGIAYGQSSPTSAKTRFVNGLYVGTKLDAYFAAADSNAIYWRADSALMAKYKGAARRVVFSGELASYKAVSDTFFTNGYTTRARTKQVIDSLGADAGSRFVTLATPQTVSGQKTFSSNLLVTGSSIQVTNTSDPSLLLNNTTSGVQWSLFSNSSGNLIINNGGGSGVSVGSTSNLTAGSFVKSGGTASQFLMADGSVNTSVLPSGAYLPLSGGTLTGALLGTRIGLSSRLVVGVQADQSYAALGVFGSLTSGSAQYGVFTDNSMGGVSNYSFYANAKLAAAAAATNTYGVYVQNPELGAGATVTNNYGLYIENQTRGGTLNYGVYSVGGLNYLGGATTFGAAINGTSLSMSGGGAFLGDITAPYLGISSSSNVLANVNTTNATGGYMTWQTNGTTIADLGTATQIFGSGGSEVFAINGRGSRAIAFGTNNTQRVTINSTGTVTLSSLGTGTVYSNGGTLTNTDPSDSTIKNTINPHKYGLAEVLKLQPKSFYYNSDSTKSSLKYGFIAQEVEKIMPDMVRKIDPKNDSSKLGLESQGIYVTMVKAIQEQQAVIEELKKRIANLEAKLN